MLAVLPLAAAALSVPSVDPSPDALECGYRKLAYAQALKLQPWRGAQRATWDALELGTMCGETPPPDNERVALPPASAVAPLRSVYVDAERGSDAASGEVDTPFRGVHRALAALRASGGKKDAIVLKDGIHYLNQTLTLGPEDSGTTITAAPGADAWLSGGAPLPQLQWKKVRDHPSGGNVWGASLAGTGVTKVPGLFTAGSKIVILSRFVALSVSLIQKVSLFQATTASSAPVSPTPIPSTPAGGTAAPTRTRGRSTRTRLPSGTSPPRARRRRPPPSTSLSCRTPRVSSRTTARRDRTISDSVSCFFRLANVATRWKVQHLDGGGRRRLPECLEGPELLVLKRQLWRLGGGGLSVRSGGPAAVAGRDDYKYDDEGSEQHRSRFAP